MLCQFVSWLYMQKSDRIFLENQTQFLMWRAYNDCVVTFATFGVGVTLLKQLGPASHSLTKLFTWLNHKPLTNFTYIFLTSFASYQNFSSFVFRRSPNTRMTELMNCYSQCFCNNTWENCPGHTMLHTGLVSEFLNSRFLIKLVL